jgi:hypothetical protein
MQHQLNHILIHFVEATNVVITQDIQAPKSQHWTFVSVIGPPQSPIDWVVHYFSLIDRSHLLVYLTVAYAPLSVTLSTPHYLSWVFPTFHSQVPTLSIAIKTFLFLKHNACLQLSVGLSLRLTALSNRGLLVHSIGTLILFVLSPARTHHL